MPGKAARRLSAATERRAQPRMGEAVRAIVFTSRLFEYECRDLGISLAQYRLLLYLRHGPKRAGDLAAQAAITRPSLSVLLVTLEKAALIRRNEVAGDGRGVSLALTRKGLSAIERVEQRFGRVLQEAAQDMDTDALVSTLSELARKLTEQVEPRVHAADPYASENQD